MQCRRNLHAATPSLSGQTVVEHAARWHPIFGFSTEDVVHVLCNPGKPGHLIQACNLMPGNVRQHESSDIWYDSLVMPVRMLMMEKEMAEFVKRLKSRLSSCLYPVRGWTHHHD